MRAFAASPRQMATICRCATGRPEAGGLQHFVDVVPGTSGQRRLMSGGPGGRIDASARELSGDYERHIVETLMPQGAPLDMARFLAPAPA